MFLGVGFSASLYLYDEGLPGLWWRNRETTCNGEMTYHWWGHFRSDNLNEKNFMDARDRLHRLLSNDPDRQCKPMGKSPLPTIWGSGCKFQSAHGNSVTVQSDGQADIFCISTGETRTRQLVWPVSDWCNAGIDPDTFCAYAFDEGGISATTVERGPGGYLKCQVAGSDWSVTLSRKTRENIFSVDNVQCGSNNFEPSYFRPKWYPRHDRWNRQVDCRRLHPSFDSGISFNSLCGPTMSMIPFDFKPFPGSAVRIDRWIDKQINAGSFLLGEKIDESEVFTSAIYLQEQKTCLLLGKGASVSYELQKRKRNGENVWVPKNYSCLDNTFEVPDDKKKAYRFIDKNQVSRCLEMLGPTAVAFAKDVFRPQRCRHIVADVLPLSNPFGSGCHLEGCFKEAKISYSLFSGYKLDLSCSKHTFTGFTLETKIPFLDVFWCKDLAYNPRYKLTPSTVCKIMEDPLSQGKVTASGLRIRAANPLRLDIQR